jgi:hypothetical protein
MAIKAFLQGFGATHLWELNNNGTSSSDDLGNSPLPSNISGGTYSFQTSPVCLGVTHSLRVEPSTNDGDKGAEFSSTTDININPLGYASGSRSVLLWFRQDAIQNPTCIYEQGGNVNNFAFMGGAQITFQAADSGQPFLIAASKTLAIAGRNYCGVGVWEYHTQHAGNGNRVLLYLNGVLQNISELNGTDIFPQHNGALLIGNSEDDLQSFAGTTYISQTTGKNENYLGFYNNVSLTESECRQIFERMVIPEVVIAADTVVNQQTALNALSGNTYQDVNCAIEIRQATDATDYTLTLNNISFVQNASLKDIAVQYVGPNTLTIVNSSSNAVEVSAPTEKDLDGGTTIITGGGTIVVSNPVVLTVISNISLVGAEVRMYDADSTGVDKGTELVGVETSASATFTTSLIANTNLIFIQIIQAGVEEEEISFTMGATSQTINIPRKPEEND